MSILRFNSVTQKKFYRHKNIASSTDVSPLGATCRLHQVG